MDAIVFGTNNCGWCKKVANTLKDHQITVIKVDVIEENNLEQMKEYAGEDDRWFGEGYVVVDEGNDAARLYYLIWIRRWSPWVCVFSHSMGRSSGCRGWRM